MNHSFVNNFICSASIPCQGTSSSGVFDLKTINVNYILCVKRLFCLNNWRECAIDIWFTIFIYMLMLLVLPLVNISNNCIISTIRYLGNLRRDHASKRSALFVSHFHVRIVTVYMKLYVKLRILIAFWSSQKYDVMQNEKKKNSNRYWDHTVAWTL